jgi:DNA repair protein RadD
MITVRDYQADLIERTRAALRRHRRVLIQLATGGGKTAVAAFMTAGALKRGHRVGFACHRDFLLDQTGKTFARVGIPHTFVAAGLGWNPHIPCTIYSIDTLRRRLDRILPPDILIVDEAKHACSASWSKVIGEWARQSVIIGLDATPVRLDGQGLGVHFDEMVSGPSVRWLMENGYLSGYRAFGSPVHADLSAVRTTAGDFNRGQLNEAMDRNVLIGDLVRHYLSHAGGKRAIYYAVSIEHSQHIAAMFRENGVRAIHLDGTSPTEERRLGARAMATGHVDVIVNVDLLGEGYDLAAQAEMDVTIEAVGLARPTHSLALHLQQIGRALRPKPGGAPAIILDHAGNIQRHGLPDMARQWSLAGIPKKKSGLQSVPTRQCKACFHIHTPAPACPECGHIYEIQGRQVKERDGELVEFDGGRFQTMTLEGFKRHLAGVDGDPLKAAEALARDLGADERELKALVALAKRRGHKPSWAAHVWAANEAKRRRAALQKE